jgi:hypothetical protein
MTPKEQTISSRKKGLGAQKTAYTKTAYNSTYRTTYKTTSKLHRTS